MNYSWNESASKHSQILQSYEWGELKSNFNWSPIYLQVGDGSLAMILKRKLPLFNKCFFYIPRGPLVDFKDGPKVKALMRAIGQEAKKHGAVFLRIDPEIVETDLSAVETLKKEGFKKAKKEIQPRATFILDLTKSLDDIKAGFENKFRYNIHVAEKNNVIVEEEKSEIAIEKFYSIYKETCSRQNFIIHPISYYQNIFSILLQKGMGSVFIAYMNDLPVAGVIVFVFGDRVWYMYGASSQKARSAMPNNLIHWEIIKWAKEKGLKEYDLWGIPTKPKEGHPLWGVYRFKKGFNAELKNFIGAYDLAYNKILYFLFDKIIEIYQNTVRFIKKGTVKDSLS